MIDSFDLTVYLSSYVQVWNVYVHIYRYVHVSNIWMMRRFNKALKLKIIKSYFGSCAAFLVHDSILQQWSSLLKNSPSIEKKKKSTRDSGRIVPVTDEESCQWLLNNCASDCSIIMPVIDEQSCQWLLNNHVSDCWTIVPLTFNNRASDCWKILPVTEQSCQWLLNNFASDCWTFVPVIVEQSCQPLLKKHATDCLTILPVYIISPYNI